MKNSYIKCLAAASLMTVSLASESAIITYGGVNATDNSGLTSTFIDPNQAPLADPTFGVNGYFIETFDAITQMNGQGLGSTLFNQNPAVGCALNSTAAGITVSGDLGVGIGNISGRASPANDTTCFGYTPSTGGSSSGSVVTNYAAFLAGVGTGFKIDYLGFYWGSADNYNTLRFFNGNDQVLSLTGNALLGANSGSSGNRIDPGSNVYVNIDFAADEVFDRIELVSTRRAMEVDNIVIGVTRVHEPIGLGVLGLLLLAIRRLRR